MCVCVYVCMRVYVHVQVHVSVRMPMCVCMYVCMYVRFYYMFMCVNYTILKHSQPLGWHGLESVAMCSHCQGAASMIHDNNMY